MKELTAGEQVVVEAKLEESAAQLLGRMLFEFGRLEMALGLCVVWIDGGRQLDALTERVKDWSFDLRLKHLEKRVNEFLPRGSNRHTHYKQWIDDANEARMGRNDLVHSRWWVDPHRAQVVRVSGLPTSPEQAEHRLTLADLEGVVDDLRQLQSRLYDLRQKWPL
jgi:hypothetical protein